MIIEEDLLTEVVILEGVPTSCVADNCPLSLVVFASSAKAEGLVYLENMSSTYTKVEVIVSNNQVVIVIIGKEFVRTVKLQLKLLTSSEGI